MGLYIYILIQLRESIQQNDSFDFSSLGEVVYSLWVMIWSYAKC